MGAAGHFGDYRLEVERVDTGWTVTLHDEWTHQCAVIAYSLPMTPARIGEAVCLLMVRLHESDAGNSAEGREPRP